MAHGKVDHNFDLVEFPSARAFGISVFSCRTESSCRTLTMAQPIVGSLSRQCCHNAPQWIPDCHSLQPLRSTAFVVFKQSRLPG